MKNDKVRTAVLGGLLMALIALATAFLAFPIPGVSGAYINAGDGAVFAAAYLMPGAWSVAVSAIGSALADAIRGSFIYVPATFVIKGCMALVAYLLFRVFKKKTGGILAALIVSGLVMPFGYFLYESILYGIPMAWVGVPFNLIQYACGVVIGFLVIKGLALIKDKMHQSPED